MEIVEGKKLWTCIDLKWVNIKRIGGLEVEI